MFKRILPLLVATGTVALVACGNGNVAPDAGGNADASGVDSGFQGSPPGTCTPVPGSTGNSKHVGAYCTAGAGQCAQYTGANVYCAIDLDPSGGNFCIFLGCQTNAACGAAACCTGNGGAINACVPILCVVDDAGAPCPPVPGTDAGTGDAA